MVCDVIVSLRCSMFLIEMCRLMDQARPPFFLDGASPEWEQVGYLNVDSFGALSSENFGAKDVDVSPFFPPIGGKTCLDACLVEKDGTVPSVFDGYLGKEDTPV